MTDYYENIKPVLVEMFAKHINYIDVVDELNKLEYKTISGKKFTTSTILTTRRKLDISIKKTAKKEPVPYVYRITCIHPTKYSGMIYFGKHVSTNPESRRYMGGGTLLKFAQNKLGMQYFTKHVIRTFNSTADAEAYESEIVEYHFIKSLDNFNVSIGGANSQNIYSAHPLKLRLLEWVQDLEYANWAGIPVWLYRKRKKLESERIEGEVIMNLDAHWANTFIEL